MKYMMEVKKFEDGYQWGDQIFFGEGKKQGMINLRTHQGEAMHYGVNIDKVIDFPGEYDVDGIMIEAMMDASSKELSYVVTSEGKKFALIQTARILDKGNFGVIDQWYYMDAQALQKLDQMEVEGEKIDLLSL